MLFSWTWILSSQTADSPRDSLSYCLTLDFIYLITLQMLWHLMFLIIVNATTIFPFAQGKELGVSINFYLSFISTCLYIQWIIKSCTFSILNISSFGATIHRIMPAAPWLMALFLTHPLFYPPFILINFSYCRQWCLSKKIQFYGFFA